MQITQKFVAIPTLIELIWNHTLVCTQPCEDCCVCAYHVTRDGDVVRMTDFSSLPTETSILRGETKYQAAQRHMQAVGLELSFERKLRVIENLKGCNCRVDLSGGDALVTLEGFNLLKALSTAVGRHNVSLTITGAGIKRELIPDVAVLISELNFTYNAAEPKDSVTRPRGYAASNLQLARRFREHGVKVRAECPIVRETASPEHLTRLYTALAGEGVETMLLMRQFDVGRGSVIPDLIPTKLQYLEAISTLRNLEKKRQGPKVRLQCALRHLDPTAADDATNPCDLGVASYGLMADGTLLASSWAVNGLGKPLDDAWVIGNLADTPLTVLLGSDKAQTLIARSAENYGQCKIHAWKHSTKPDAFERLFDKADPLYIDNHVDNPLLVTV